MSVREFDGTDRHLLESFRFVTRATAAGTGAGSRPSARVGAGIEFAEYRPFESGDEARRIDPGVYARWGQAVVRENVTEQAVPHRIVVDLTASMAAKRERALQLASAIAYIAVGSGDHVRVATFDGSGVRWSPVATDARRFRPVERWLAERADVGGRRSIDSVATELLARKEARAVVVLITDAWDEDVTSAIRRLAAAGAEVSAVVTLTAEERDPSRHGSGPVRWVDAETGEERDVMLNDATFRAVRDRVRAHHEAIRRETNQSGGRTAVVSVEDPVHRIVTGDLVRSGMLARTR